jgi:hypothetical protein
MSATLQEKRWARIEADRRFALHSSDMNYDPHFGVSAIDCREATYRSLLCECVFARYFGVQVDCEFRPQGDGGKDFCLMLETSRGPKCFHVNVKATTVKSNWKALQRTTHLRVPVDECRPHTIYVFGIYLLREDDADVLGWEWGQTLIAANDIRVFDKRNFVRLFTDLRKLDELRERLR